MTEITDRPAKPMNATERRALISLIKNDFDQMRSRLGASHKEFLDRRTKEVNDKYADEMRRVAEASRRVRELAESLRRQWEDLRIELAAQGVTFAGGYGSAATIELPSAYAKLTAREEELAELRRVADVAYRRADAELVDKRSEAERAVLLTAILSDEAKQMLESVPRAEAVFEQALQGVPPRTQLPAAD